MAVLFSTSKSKSGCQNLIITKTPLQVHEISKPCLVKRAYPCTSGFSASMTIEAALALPVALFFFLALLQPVTWLDKQRKVQTCLERVGEEISQYGILADVDNRGENFEDGLPAFCTDAAAALWIRGRAGQYAGHVSVKKAETYGENGEIELSVEYQDEVPFFGKLLGRQTSVAAVKRRAWIGLRGKLKGDGSYGGTYDEKAEETVFVGAGMGRYHLFRDCHYISNEYQTVTKEAAEKGTGSGGKRTPCAVCRKHGTDSGMVYITAAGEHYHHDKNCTSMISYVQEIPKTEVGHLGVCSYCARKEGGKK